MYEVCFLYFLHLRVQGWPEQVWRIWWAGVKVICVTYFGIQSDLCRCNTQWMACVWSWWFQVCQRWHLACGSFCWFQLWNVTESRGRWSRHVFHGVLMCPGSAILCRLCGETRHSHWHRSDTGQKSLQTNLIATQLTPRGPDDRIPNAQEMELPKWIWLYRMTRGLLSVNLLPPVPCWPQLSSKCCTRTSKWRRSLQHLSPTVWHNNRGTKGWSFAEDTWGWSVLTGLFWQRLLLQMKHGVTHMIPGLSKVTCNGGWSMSHAQPNPDASALPRSSFWFCTLMPMVLCWQISLMELLTLRFTSIPCTEWERQCAGNALFFGRTATSNCCMTMLRPILLMTQLNSLNLLVNRCGSTPPIHRTCHPVISGHFPEWRRTCRATDFRHWMTSKQQCVGNCERSPPKNSPGVSTTWHGGTSSASKRAVATLKEKGHAHILTQRTDDMCLDTDIVNCVQFGLKNVFFLLKKRAKWRHNFAE